VEEYFMIIGTYFSGDNDDKLKMLQHGCYYDMLREWITMAGVRRLRYRTSPEWAEVTQMWEQFREGGCFDHRKIQMPHDLIAARFRMATQELAIPDDAKEDAWYGQQKCQQQRVKMVQRLVFYIHTFGEPPDLRLQHNIKRLVQNQRFNCFL
jgi:hypothetical protein